MQTTELYFYSGGSRLDGLLQVPDGALSSGHSLPTVVLCSGFQGLKELIPAKLWHPFTEAGFACFAFDYRGFGTSEGERGGFFPWSRSRTFAMPLPSFLSVWRWILIVLACWVGSWEGV
ncbi:MAG: serine aminopeptidase domain-containing protein [Candidatus Dormibacteraceae bacterium]